MRPLLILVVSCFFGCFGCKKVDKKPLTIQVQTYDYDLLDYPGKDIKIPDSLQNEFIKNFFAPWKIQPDNLLITLAAFPGKALPYLDTYLHDDAWYGENKKQHKKHQRAAIVANADTDGFPNFQKKGIIIAHTNLRRLPTNKPGFDLYSKAGEGFPFDYFQETALWANTPVFIAHTTKDKQWCYVISPYYKGWVSMHDLAVVDQDFIEQWSTGNYSLPKLDDLSLRNDDSLFAVNAKMGMVLPYNEASVENPGKITVYFATANEKQNGMILKAEVDQNTLALGDVTIREDNLRELVSNLIGRPYGWGGNLENRDCSSMIRDLFSTYKIWLPRDSKDQINHGHKYDLSGTSEEKIAFIKEKATPFFTILRKKGHNMLYVGNTPDGEPLILHAIWGLKTTYSDMALEDVVKTYPIEGIHKDENGLLRGRHIIGEAVITSVSAGDVEDQVTTPLIEEIYAMTNILED
ncbi:MAG: SH3 domain-containing protein [Bacteroidota bacterium]